MTSYVNSFQQLLNKLEADGYKVEQVSEDAAVVFNNNVHSNYSAFDNTVATVAMQNGFGFAPPSNMKKLHEKTVLEDQPASKFELYLGLFEEDDTALREESEYSFLEKSP